MPTIKTTPLLNWIITLVSFWVFPNGINAKFAGDIHTKITELEVAVVQELIRVVFSYQDSLAYISDILAELDW